MDHEGSGELVSWLLKEDTDDDETEDEWLLPLLDDNNNDDDDDDDWENIEDEGILDGPPCMPVVNSMYKSGPVDIIVTKRLLLHSWAMIGEADERPSCTVMWSNESRQLYSRK